METTSNHRRLLTSMNLVSNILPYYGHIDQDVRLMKSICKATYQLWKENETPLFTIVLKNNRRGAKLGKKEYLDRLLMDSILRYFRVELTQLDSEGCKLLYQLLFCEHVVGEGDEKYRLDPVPWDFLEIGKVDFLNMRPNSGVWHLLLLRKFAIKGLSSLKIHCDHSLLEDLVNQPPTLCQAVASNSPENVNFLESEYILEDNLKIAKNEKQLWDLLRMKISLYLPHLDIDEQEANSNSVSFYKDAIKSINFTSDDIDEHLHTSFEKVTRMFPNCTELSLNWYYDDDNEDAIEYNKLFEDISNSKVTKFELNPCSKRRSFSLYNKQCRVYVYSSNTDSLECYLVDNAHFYYDSNQWSTEYYSLSRSIIAFKSPKNFSFENCHQAQSLGRHKDLIGFYLGEQRSRKPWIFVSAPKFDTVEFKEGEDASIHNKNRCLMTYTKVRNSSKDQWGSRSDSLLDIVYLMKPKISTTQKNLSLNRSNSYGWKNDDKNINKKMVGLIVQGQDIDDDVFEELCDIIYDFPDTITDIKVSLKNQYQYEYFMKTIRRRKKLINVVFTEPRFTKHVGSFGCRSFQIAFSKNKDAFMA